MSLPAEMNVLLSDVRADKSFLDFSLSKKPTPEIEGPRDIIIMHGTKSIIKTW